MEKSAEIRNENLTNALRDLGVDPITFAAFLEATVEVSAVSRKLLTELDITPATTAGCLDVEMEVTFGELMRIHNPQTVQQMERGTDEAKLIMSILNPNNSMTLMK